jgi:hypothetical protein
MARTKIPVSLRLDPEIKATGEARAKDEMRSFASYLEWLIVEDAKRQASVRQSAPSPPVASTWKRGK